MCVLRLLRDYKDEIASAGAIIGVLVGVFGFWFTIDQLKSNERTLKAANAYEIQRDARALVDEISQDAKLQKLIRGESLSELEVSDVRKLLWKMNNFYLSVFRQVEAGGVADGFKSSYRRDFCSFVKIPSIERQWLEMRKTGMVADGHAGMREAWCP